MNEELNPLENEIQPPEEETKKTFAEINAANLDKANKIYLMLKEAGYTAEDLAMTDFLINPHRPPVRPCPPPPMHRPPMPPCPPPKPPRCDVAEFTAPRPIVKPHDHREHEHEAHNMHRPPMPPKPPMVEFPLPFCDRPMAPAPQPPHNPFPLFTQDGNNLNGIIRPPVVNPPRVAQADWKEKNPYSTSYIVNKPTLVATINSVKPNEENNIVLKPKDIGLEPMSNVEISSVIDAVYHIFDGNNNCNCGCQNNNEGGM